MPRNSSDNSLGRFTEIVKISKSYSLKNELLRTTNLSKSETLLLKEINKIDNACEAIADPYLTILRNTFFDKKPCYWWADLYSKTTYYRLRNKAINTFLLAYNLQ